MLTIKTPKRRQWRRFGVFIVNFEHISHLYSNVPIVNFKHVTAGWVLILVRCKCSFIIMKSALLHHRGTSLINVNSESVGSFKTGCDDCRL